MVTNNSGVENRKTRDDQLLRALEVGAAWVNEARLSNNAGELDEASDAFLRLAEIACQQGLHTYALSISPGSTLDGPKLKQIVHAVRSRRVPKLKVVK